VKTSGPAVGGGRSNPRLPCAVSLREITNVRGKRVHTTVQCKKQRLKTGNFQITGNGRDDGDRKENNIQIILLWDLTATRT